MKKLLISRCLLGDPCRYDGKSKPLPAQTLQKLRARYTLIPVCPEVLGGLDTPRTPSERQGDRVVMATGEDVTAQYRLGAEIALETAQREQVSAALLKERSPSCGKGEIYDGSFSKTLIAGNGVTAEKLLDLGFAVYGESEIEKLIESGELRVES